MKIHPFSDTSVFCESSEKRLAVVLNIAITVSSGRVVGLGNTSDSSMSWITQPQMMTDDDVVPQMMKAVVTPRMYPCSIERKRFLRKKPNRRNGPQKRAAETGRSTWRRWCAGGRWSSCRRSEIFINFETEFLVFDTQFLVFNSEFLVFKAKFIISTDDSSLPRRRRPRCVIEPHPRPFLLMQNQRPFLLI